MVNTFFEAILKFVTTIKSLFYSCSGLQCETCFYWGKKQMKTESVIRQQVIKVLGRSLQFHITQFSW